MNLLCIIKHTNREGIFFFSLVSSEQIIIVKGNDWALEGWDVRSALNPWPVQWILISKKDKFNKKYKIDIYSNKTKT